MISSRWRTCSCAALIFWRASTLLSSASASLSRRLTISIACRSGKDIIKKAAAKSRMNRYAKLMTDFILVLCWLDAS